VPPTTYYVSSLNGRGTNDGLSEASAADSWRRLAVRPGDTVRFERGSSFRETIVSPDGEPGRPISWRAYGSGPLPAFYGSVDISSPGLWESEGRNVWRCVKPLDGEVANVILDGGREYGILAWRREELFKPCHWHYTHVGFLKDERAKRAMAGTTPNLTLFSHGNPGERYASIECSIRSGTSYIATGQRHIVIENLAFLYAPVTAFTVADGEDITIRGCSFRGTGGLVHTHGSRIRCGNAIEFWDGADDILVEHNVFEETYDSCVTHQGPHESPKVPKRLRFLNNTFVNYGMAAYEGRDKVGVGTMFCGNICRGAGVGFAGQDETPPRRSEIWPRPMGHHVFLWRMDSATDEESITISGNSFHEAPHGAAVYSIVSLAAERRIFVRENRYFMRKSGLTLRLNGRDYDEREFHELRFFGNTPKREYLRDLLDDLARKYPDTRVVNIVCHGHSVPAGYFATPRVDTLRAYPHRLLETIKDRFPFATVNVIATARGGEDSVGGARRFRDEALCHRPSLVTIDYSLNDVRVGLAAAHAAWCEMVESCLERGIKVILLTPTLTNQHFAETTFTRDLEEHAEQVRLIAEKYQVGLADPSARWKRHLDEGGDLCDLLSHVNHPSALGHDLVVAELSGFFLPR
jgi:acyl-CoA thioesterase I